MANRFHALFIAALLATVQAMSASAQAPGAQAPESSRRRATDPATDPRSTRLPSPGSRPRNPGSARIRNPSWSSRPPICRVRRPANSKINIDKLFEALKIAPTEESAKYVENRIWALWLAAGGDTGNLLMGARQDRDGREGARPRASSSSTRSSTSSPTTSRPGTGARRSTSPTRISVSALADIHEVLMREPRHFGALSGLGMIMQELGDDKRALEAFRRALAVHPQAREDPRAGEEAHREGRRPRYLTARSHGRRVDGQGLLPAICVSWCVVSAVSLH